MPFFHPSFNLSNFTHLCPFGPFRRDSASLLLSHSNVCRQFPQRPHPKKEKKESAAGFPMQTEGKRYARQSAGSTTQALEHSKGQPPACGEPFPLLHVKIHSLKNIKGPAGPIPASPCRGGQLSVSLSGWWQSNVAHSPPAEPKAKQCLTALSRGSFHLPRTRLAEAGSVLELRKVPGIPLLCPLQQLQKA